MVPVIASGAVYIFGFKGKCIHIEVSRKKQRSEVMKPLRYDDNIIGVVVAFAPFDAADCVEPFWVFDNDMLRNTLVKDKIVFHRERLVIMGAFLAAHNNFLNFTIME